MTAALKLDEEYRSIRTALIDAGLMTDSIDSLYRDWCRWREKSHSRTPVNRVTVGNLDQWWTQHLAQFRSLLDAPHVAARAERERKDQLIGRND